MQAAGISDSLVRMAFGIEDTEDLLKDVEQALEKVGQRLKVGGPPKNLHS